MLGGSLTRFQPDEYYQDGKGIMWEMARGGLQGLKRSRNPLKAPGNTLKGLKEGLARGVKRKAEQVIKKEINKRAKKALSNKNVKTAVQVASALHVSQTDQESARHFWSLKKKKERMRKKKMPPVHSRPRSIRSDRGLPQYGGWLPEFELVQRLFRPRR